MAGFDRSRFKLGTISLSREGKDEICMGNFSTVMMDESCRLIHGSREDGLNFCIFPVFSACLETPGQYAASGFEWFRLTEMDMRRNSTKQAHTALCFLLHLYSVSST